MQRKNNYNLRFFKKVIILLLFHKIKYLGFIWRLEMAKKEDIVIIYDENAEIIEDKILKIFKRYLENVMK